MRVPENLLAALDDLVERGAYPSRASAVRAGLRAILEIEQRRATDRAVIDGYLRVPPTVEEEAAALASLRDAISEESW